MWEKFFPHFTLEGVDTRTRTHTHTHLAFLLIRERERERKKIKSRRCDECNKNEQHCDDSYHHAFHPLSDGKRKRAKRSSGKTFKRHVRKIERNDRKLASTDENERVLETRCASRDVRDESRAAVTRGGREKNQLGMRVYAPWCTTKNREAFWEDFGFGLRRPLRCVYLE